MLSLSSLLNPASPGPSNGNRFPPSPTSSSPTDSCGEDSLLLTNRPTMPKNKLPKDAAVFTKSKPKGDINFRPYEHLDEISLRLTYRFNVYPLGKIQEYSRHIPYNSGKKDFFEKTGRESFEVFQYTFKVPDDDTEYVVMWDYNVGLVRMTPFFKCCKYPKTTPAKMLNSNPGLKEITHSITGGSIMAQGYWMPYQCARAVCATFCHNIAGALIPIFGPDFPALCTPAEAPEYSRMIIDPAIIIQSTREAEYYRRLYSNTASLGSASRNMNGHASSKRDRRVFRSPYDDNSGQHPRYRVRKTYATTPGSENSSYTTDTDGEVSPQVDCSGLARESPHHHFPRFPHSPMPPPITSLRPSNANGSNSGWTPVNVPQSSAHVRSYTDYHPSGPSPWLSAIPRFTTIAHMQSPPHLNANTPKMPRQQHYVAAHPLSQSQLHPQSEGYHHINTAHRQLPSPSGPPPHSSQLAFYQSPRAKRSVTHVETDVTSDHHHPGPQSRMPQIYHTDKENRTGNLPVRTNEESKSSAVANVGVDKRAALLLMNLSVRDQLFWKGVGKCQMAEEILPSVFRDANGRGSSNGDGYRATVDSADICGRGYPPYSASASTTLKNGRTGVSSDKTSPLDGSFPPIKRFRSNSM
ncbi:hypothetical protein GGS21DRAFT_543255 [Xylaria nigripes]|nr:hypothetical protein GGS21DRAFT_543255 [Xylaria nigripes]